jgi:hypothetical protein
VHVLQALVQHSPLQPAGHVLEEVCIFSKPRVQDKKN